MLNWEAVLVYLATWKRLLCLCVCECFWLGIFHMKEVDLGPVFLGFWNFVRCLQQKKTLLVVSILFWHSILGGRMVPSFYSFFSYLNIWRYKLFLNQFPLNAVDIECDVASYSIWKEWYVQLASIALCNSCRFSYSNFILNCLQEQRSRVQEVSLA